MQPRTILALACGLSLAAAAALVVGYITGLSFLDYVIIFSMITLSLLAVWLSAVHRPNRTTGRTALPQKKGATYNAYSGLGILFALFLSVPVGAVGIALGVSVAAPVNSEILGAILAATVWAFGLSYALSTFVPFEISISENGITFLWPRLGKSTVSPWSRVALRHIYGPFFSAGPIWTLPLSWFSIKRHRDFVNKLEALKRTGPRVG